MAEEDVARRCLCQALEEEYGELRPTFKDARSAPPRGQSHGSATPKEDVDVSKTCEPTLKQLYARVHGLEEPLRALCLSGGGIRSATFALGILEYLAERGMLRRMDILSTVSGGGYIGSWLSAWIRRADAGAAGVEASLREGVRSPSRPIDPEPPPVRHLRFFSNYLSPKIGLLSADTWTLAATYLRNLLLNWIVFLPLLAAVLVVPRLSVAGSRFAHGGVGALILIGLGSLLSIWALCFISLNRPSLRPLAGETGPARVDQPQFLRLILAELLLSAVLLTTGWAFYRNAGSGVTDAWGVPLWAVLALYGVVIHVVAFVIRASISRLYHQKDEQLAKSKTDRSTTSKEAKLDDPATGEVVESSGPTPKPPGFAIELVLVAASGAVAGLLLWLASTKTVLADPKAHPVAYATLAVPLFFGLFLVAATVFVGGFSKWMDDEDREWLARLGAWILIPVVAWLVLSALVLYAPFYLVRTFGAAEAALTAAGLTGLYTLVAGFSSRTSSQGKARQKPDGGKGPLDYLLTFAAPAFLLLIVVALSIGTDAAVAAVWRLWPGSYHAASWFLADWLHHHDRIVQVSPARVLGVVAVGLVAVGVGMGLLVNTNRFSLHAMYRSRLIRAYLGASKSKRNPNPFTGFDPYDNVQMWQLAENRTGPMHVVNMALNVVSGTNLAWQERKAISFTASPLHCGSYCVGYRPSKVYGGDSGVSLGTAVAISGAAASPNMGYHSSPVVTFIMTLFNARLGWWLGNPGGASTKETFRRAYPMFSIGPIVEEALGLTNETRPYVYLSDGGHFENLALYEMVLRRCRVIVVSDAGCDGEHAFEDLGNAVRKIRIDLGVPITFEKLDILPRDPEAPKSATPRNSHFAVGAIGYSKVDATAADGVLIYIKPALCGDEPTDVRNYAAAHPDFPHESTGDQWFSESQFESYRALGYASALAAGADLELHLPHDP